MKKYFPIFIISLLVFIAFIPFLLKNKLPIPSDTIVGLYHPFRDFYAKEYARGIPFKNFLITDPVRQQYIWRNEAVESIKHISPPLWNPYNFAGTPLLANFQTAAFYPLNIIFFIFPFSYGWSILILFQPLLAGIFLYLYLRHMRLDQFASIFAAIAFSFSGFSVAWMEWNTLLHAALWLPLILLCIENVFNKHHNIQHPKQQLKNKKRLWFGLFTLALSFSLFAGHTQTFFYVFIISLVYLLFRWFQYGRNKRILFAFLFCYFLFALVTSVQWIPTLQFIGESARDIDQSNWQKEGWFIPWQHLVQFLAPDFFGNPATLNYYGAWNYAEFLGYIGIVPLIFAIFALCFRHDKKTFFFGTLFFLSLLFALPNTIVSSLPFILKIPFIASAQPTRLLFITDFSLAILAGLGLDYFLKKDLRYNKKLLYILFTFAFCFLLLWAFVLKGNTIIKNISVENLQVAKRNLYFPSFIFITSFIILALAIFIKKKKLQVFFLVCLFLLMSIDLLRTFSKFTPFTSSEYLYPQTPSLSFLQKHIGNYRLMTTDNRILPPNFSGIYNLQSVDGYDPLYLMRYAELIATNERSRPDISPPFGFNRIITPQRFESSLIDLLGVKYVLSLSDISSPKLTKVFQEGLMRIYENKKVLPRVYFVSKIMQFRGENKQQVIEYIFKKDIDFKNEAIVENNMEKLPELTSVGNAEIISYSAEKVLIKMKNNNDGFLVFTDTFYPTWKAREYSENGEVGREYVIYRTDYQFRGIFVPKGEHIVKFYNTLI